MAGKTKRRHISARELRSLAEHLGRQAALRGQPLTRRRGRRRPGEQTLVQALVQATGLSRYVVHRLLSGRPRSGRGRAMESSIDADAPGPARGDGAERLLAATGLADTRPVLPAPPLDAAAEAREALREALAWFQQDGRPDAAEAAAMAALLRVLHG